MQKVELTILFDHKAQIARGIKVKLYDRDFHVHPVFYAYAQLAQQKTCAHSKMTLVRMLMQDQPRISSKDAVAIVHGLMINDQTRLLAHDRDEQVNVDVQFRDVDHYTEQLIRHQERSRTSL